MSYEYIYIERERLAREMRRALERHMACNALYMCYLLLYCAIRYRFTFSLFLTVVTVCILLMHLHMPCARMCTKGANHAWLMIMTDLVTPCPI